MGWIASTAYRIGVGAVASPTEVEESEGFTGEWVTPTGQPDWKNPKVRIKLNPAFNGGVVFGSRSEAMRESKKRLKADR